jgi:hypothetical protein
MKKLILVSLIVLSVLACKKTEFTPEGPTDVRIKNISDITFSEVVVSTSEIKGDTLVFGNILSGATSEYIRFSKAYPKAEISAMIAVNGALVKFSTGPVDYTFMNYIGQDMITYEVFISNMNTHKLEINKVVLDAPLVLK